MADLIEDMCDSDEVEINERGEIVFFGQKGRRGVHPPKHTFY